MIDAILFDFDGLMVDSEPHSIASWRAVLRARGEDSVVSVTLLGIVADRFGVPFALKSIFIFPVVGFMLTLALHYPVREKA